MPIFKIQHITRYQYDRPVRESANQIKIFPYEHQGQETISHELDITNDPTVNVFFDYFGNKVGFLTVADAHDELVIDSRLVVKTAHLANNPVVVSKANEWELLRGQVDKDMRLLDLSKPEPLKSKNTLQSLVDELRPRWDSPAMFIQRCSEHIYGQFTYKKGITTVETTVDEIMEHQSGVCQDFAHVLLEMLRLVGMPARYVSGYICPNRDGVRGAGATHAWVEVYLPSTGGWVGIDPTNNTWVSDLHVCLAVGRHFRDCSPVKGTFKGPANQQLSVHVSVGFEDGSKFEDSNTVDMNAESSTLPTIDFGSAQQQQ